jgi:hypothetical protein
MLNPLSVGDTIELDSPSGGHVWTVYRGQGWGLKSKTKLSEQTVIHDTIHDIDGMADFIGAIIEWSKAYS